MIFHIVIIIFLYFNIDFFWFVQYFLSNPYMIMMFPHCFIYGKNIDNHTVDRETLYGKRF